MESSFLQWFVMQMCQHQTGDPRCERDLTRSLTTGEMPIGVLTALIEAPIFALLLRRRTLAWR